jgi:hypothetical protein
MAYYNRVWSVASVFNEDGMFRYEKAFNQAYICHEREFTHQHIDEQRISAESVADCIRKLGYTVLCEFHSSEDRGRYVISQISKKKFYYGSEFGTNYQHLSGKRTIYEMTIELEERHYENLCEQGLCRGRSYNLRDISGEIAQKKIKSWIEDGSLCNKTVDSWDRYEQGVSTIGNTLPSDIVQALQDFTSDCPYFTQEPEYEFYIPPTTQELPDACPPPEPANNQVGAHAPAPALAAAQAAAAQAAAAQAAAAPAPAPASKKTYSTSDSSDDDSDDDC